MHNDKGKEEIFCSWIKAVRNLKKCCYLMTKIWYFFWTNLSRRFNNWLFVGWLSVVFFSWLSCFGLLESIDRQLPAVYQQTADGYWGSAILQFRQTFKPEIFEQWPTDLNVIDNTKFFCCSPPIGHNTPDSYDKLTLLLQNKVLNIIFIHVNHKQTLHGYEWLPSNQQKVIILLMNTCTLYLLSASNAV